MAEESDMVFSFFRKWREKELTGIVTTGKAQPEPPDDDMDWLFPPCDVRDHVVWDHYWQDQIAHGLSPPLFDMFCDDAPLIQCLIKRRAKTLLCAGNGISQEPRALAAAGFEVIAMDLSPAAVHLADIWQFSSKELDRFCTKEQRAQGGTVKFAVGDILDRSVCPGPFDAIIERRTLQLFREEERNLAVDALASRLQANGLFLSHCHDGTWKPPNEPVHQVEQVFRDRGWSVTWKSPDYTGRVVWLQMSTG
jgi:hypothetical protein